MAKTEVYTHIFQGNFDEVVGYFQEHPDEINDLHPENALSPLHYAVRFNNAPVLIYLLQKQADPNIRNRAGSTPLHLASTQDQSELIDPLLDFGAKIDSKDECYYTPLHLAVLHKARNASRILLKRTANLEETVNGKTALRISQNHCHTEIEKMLLAETPQRSPSLLWLCACKIASDETLRKKFYGEIIQEPEGSPNTTGPFDQLKRLVELAPFRAR